MATTAQPITRSIEKKQWGIHVRLASLRSKRNWGVGDFTDLKNLAMFANAKQAHVLSIEPIQPVSPTDDWNVVSYASRDFISPAYIDIDIVPSYLESEDIRRHVLGPVFQTRLASLRSEPIVNFSEVLAQKLSVLQLCYQHFREADLGNSTDSAVQYRTFQKSMGQPLRNFALFQALTEKFEPANSAKNLGWKSWPAAYSTLDSEGTKEFAQSNLERIEFFEYLQWLADVQLNSVIDFCFDKQNFSILSIQQPDRLDAAGPDSWINQGGTESGEGNVTLSKVPPVLSINEVDNAVHIVSEDENVRSIKADQAALILIPLTNFLHEPGEPISTDWRAKLNLDVESLVDEPNLDRLLRDMNKVRPKTTSDLQSVEASEKLVASLPNSTYRFQFNKEFTFKDATKLVPYLAKLGISHCYASPFLKARPGSMHGYDIIDHKQINPEIGTPADLDKLVDKLHEHAMGLILDIVPNHMGVGKVNEWWMDVLENGPASIFADYFDIDWTPVKPELYGKVTLPVLGESYGVILKGGHFKLQFTPATGSLAIRYYDNEFPVNPATYPAVLGNRLDVLRDRLGKNNTDVMVYESILTALAALPSHTEQKGFSGRVREIQVQLNRLAHLCSQNAEITNFIEQNLHEFEVRPDDKLSYERMHNLLEAQAYRLVFWRVASDEINYRRFFDINELAAVRTEDPRVFNEMHELVFNLIGEKKLDGLRIDHPDGLFDPAAYFAQLQKKAAEKMQLPAPLDAELTLGKETLPIYIVVEKILAPFEHLEDDWAVHGTVGYEFLNSVFNVLIAVDNEHAFDSAYEAFIGRIVDYESAKRECKGLILDTVLASELHVLAHRLSQIAEDSWEYRDFTQNSLRKALRHIVSNFPVYRTYVTPQKVDKTAKQYIDWAIRLAKRFGSAVAPEVYDFVRNVLCLEAAEIPAENDEPALQFLHAIQTIAMKFQQFTGPVMAKSVEDTLFYRFNRFVCLNEVGGEPDRFGITVSSFHHQNIQRQTRRPYEMLATSTHDTKRSEDVRARLAVLSEIPKIWEQKTSQWSRINRSRKTIVDEEQMPDANDEYLIYQTLVGACPVGISDTDWVEPFKARVTEYALKAARESKLHTSWINKNEAYENALTLFIDRILTVSQTNPFIDDFVQFHNAIYPLGLVNSLSQAALKFTSPGVPDIYQGNEVFDFSLVDPDNRRPVDFGERNHLLNKVSKHIRIGENASEQDLEHQKRFLQNCLNDIEDGSSKLLITAVAVACRKRHQNLYTKGRYIPLEVHGPAEQHVIAFAREFEDNWSITVVPRLVSTLLLKGDATTKLPVFKLTDVLSEGRGKDLWGDTTVVLPSELTNHNLTDCFSRENLEDHRECN